MSRPALTALLIVSTLLGACGRQERIISITSDPPGALVWLNDDQLGRTPVEAEFTFFGTYDVRLAKEGYESLSTSREAVGGIHEFPVIDLVAAAIPGTRRTRLEWHFQLTPLPEISDRAAAEAQLAERARAFAKEALKATSGDDAKANAPVNGLSHLPPDKR